MLSVFGIGAEKVMNYGRYEIFREVGKGSMGVVYMAHDPQIDRAVALKVLRPDRITSEDFVERFLKEARAIGRLSHPNIVTVYDSGQDQGTLYIVMEYLTGKTLIEANREKPLSLQEVIHTCEQVAEALDYAHQQGIVHRDIKPSNILLTPEGRVKITDFGIAHIEDPALHHQTQVGDILGTPVYMSPEQVLGKNVDRRSDLYSLGVILYELATGRKPFHGENLSAIFRSIIEDKPPVPEIAGPTVAQRLPDLVMKSISKAPEERFQSGAEMARALKDCLQRRKSDVPIGEPHPPKPRKGRLALPLSLAAALLVGAAAYWMFFRSIPSESPWQAATPPITAPTTEPSPLVKTAPHAVLDLASTPSGADVFLDGSLKGKTPFKFDLPLGKYEVRLRLPNHLDWEGQLQLDKEGITPVVVRLMPTAVRKP